MIDEKDIERMATLCKLEISKEDMPFYVEELEALLEFARAVDNTADWQEDSQIVAEFTPLREDVACPSVSQYDALKNSKGSENGFVKLQKRS